jgi:hypothetical protein
LLIPVQAKFMTVIPSEALQGRVEESRRGLYFRTPARQDFSTLLRSLEMTVMNITFAGINSTDEQELDPV